MLVCQKPCIIQVFCNLEGQSRCTIQACCNLGGQRSVKYRLSAICEPSKGGGYKSPLDINKRPLQGPAKGNSLLIKRSALGNSLQGPAKGLPNKKLAFLSSIGAHKTIPELPCYWYRMVCNRSTYLQATSNRADRVEQPNKHYPDGCPEGAYICFKDNNNLNTKYEYGDFYSVMVPKKVLHRHPLYKACYY